MAEYLARIGPAGAMMMRQTAAFQVSLDVDDEPWRRWTRAERGRAVHHRDLRQLAGLRRRPDRLPQHAGPGLADARSRREPVCRGTPRARCAPISISPCAPRRSCCRSSAESTGPSASGCSMRAPTLEEWREHLSTLFPEVRPRGHFELRSCDAVPPQWYAAPLALAVGITYDPRGAHAALDLLGRPDLGLLDLAGRVGLADARHSADGGGSGGDRARTVARRSDRGTSIRRTWSRRGASSICTRGGGDRRGMTSWGMR